ncbi:hypothetical protein [Dermatobacter hominis]|uniref:hypothetical protein n=1 Tax=Dermatobacter hominis TaxID=2884263 RepID=UPI001D0F6371|nr:hypothetical protein [Dermatobacter hominis]UDY36981.1 hypothetical protein LH044_05450 [Dermatobacter hominis]
MTTQLTLISVPATPARQDAGDEAADVTPTDRTPSLTVLPAPAPEPGTTARGAHRRSVEHQGWLDRRTISTGRKGIAAARAALADANRRVADRQAAEEAEREAELARQARGITGTHAA